MKASEIKIVYKNRVRASERAKVTCSGTAADVLRRYWDRDTLEHIEEFKVLLLNRANKVLGILKVSQGGVSGTVADPKIIFQAALKCNASAVILSHNHPSGNDRPSQADIKLTKKLSEAGKFLDISVLDHIILTVDKHFSFLDEGLI